MSSLGKKNDGRHGGLKVQLVGQSDDHRTEVRDALAALGDPALHINEIEPDPDVATDVNFDVTMGRPIRLNERFSLQLRGEVFNVLNHTNFRTQATGLFNKSGGVLASAGQLPAPTLTTSRQIQFGAKFIF